MFRPFLYRKVLIWTFISLALASFVLFKHRDGVYKVAHLGHGQPAPPSGEEPLSGESLAGGEGDGSSTSDTDVVHDDNLNQNEIGIDGIIDVNDKEADEQKQKEDDELSKMTWLKFPQSVTPASAFFLFALLTELQPRRLLLRSQGHRQQARALPRVPEQDV